MSNTLEACPFCGATNAKPRSLDDDNFWFRVECQSCLCGTGEEPGQDAAINRWNEHQSIPKERLLEWISKNKQEWQFDDSYGASFSGRTVFVDDLLEAIGSMEGKG